MDSETRWPGLESQKFSGVDLLNLFQIVLDMGHDQRTHLGQQLIARVSALLNNLLYVDVQALAIINSVFHCCDYDNWDAPPVFVFANFLNKLKAIHFGHHQIEQNHPWMAVANAIQSDPPVFGLDDVPAVLFQHPGHDLSYRSIVLDKENFAALSIALVFAQHGQQPFFFNRFGEVVSGTERIAHTLIRDNRHHDHRNAGCLGIRLERGKYRPSIHPRHHDIEGNGIRHKIFGFGKPFLTAAGDFDTETFAHQ